MHIKNFKILFVDNSRTTRVAMGKLLEKNGYEVDTAGTGAEAIEKLESESFNLVIMDLYMPGMNGHEAAKLIREKSNPQLKEIPIIALTASDDDKDIGVARDAGMDEFLVKSKDNTELLATIETFYQAAS